MWCILQISNHMNYDKPNLEGLAEKIWGKAGKIIVFIFLMIAQLSVFIGANLFISEFLSDLFCVSDNAPFCYSKNVYMMISLFFCVFVLLIPDLKKFQMVSTISSIIILLTSK